MHEFYLRPHCISDARNNTNTIMLRIRRLGIVGLFLLVCLFDGLGVYMTIPGLIMIHVLFNGLRVRIVSTQRNINFLWMCLI